MSLTSSDVLGKIAEANKALRGAGRDARAVVEARDGAGDGTTDGPGEVIAQSMRSETMAGVDGDEVSVEDGAVPGGGCLARRAVRLYTEVIRLHDEENSGEASVVTESQCLSCYCNRSAAHAKLGAYEAAVRDADAVIDTGLEIDVGLVLKAYHRKAQALWELGEKVEAVKAYKAALSLQVNAPHESDAGVLREAVQAAAALMVAQMPYGWVAAYYIKLLAKCEAPHPWSRRDGLLLKRVPDSFKLETEVVRRTLVEGMDGDEVFQRACQKGVVDLWSGAQGMKSLCAYVRGYVYYRASRNETNAGEGEVSDATRDALLRWGELDATVAIVYQESERKAAYPAAHALRGLCYEARGENVLAVMDVLQAIEGERAAALEWEDEEGVVQDGVVQEGVEDGGVGNRGGHGKIFDQALSRLLPRIPEHYAAAINEGCGYAGLQKMMKVEQERMQPEFMKNRPKYYYYYEWMKKRIRQRHPELAEAVMDKLLTLDAAELDLLLQYPQAIDATVGKLEDVLQERGEEGLEQYEVPLLSWGDVQELKVSGGETVGKVEASKAPAALEGTA